MRKLLLGIFLVMLFSTGFADLVPYEPLNIVDKGNESLIAEIPTKPISENSTGPFVVLVFDDSTSMRWAIDVPKDFNNGAEYLKDLEEYESIPWPVSSKDEDRASELRNKIDAFEIEMSDYLSANELPRDKYVRIDAAKNSGSNIIQLLESLQTDAGLVDFSEFAYETYYIGNNYRELSNTVKSLQTNGGTNIGDGLFKAVDLITGERSYRGTENEGIIILFTDGRPTSGLTTEELMNFSDKYNPVVEAKSKNIKICTVGFGSKKAVDEELLKAIAEEGNCNYSFGGTSYEFDIALAEAVQSSVTKKLETYNGQIKQDETLNLKKFTVAKGLGKLVISLIWPGSTVGLEVTDPNGKKFTPQTVGDTFAYLTVENPVPGDYLTSLTGQKI
ncbi:MAG: VWA domain-containing protein, partial [Candidatus Diapherotrites archaeon]|nr:VWA domain-containing protein [Candidatus Diapherotrites archaeon]